MLVHTKIAFCLPRCAAQPASARRFFSARRMPIFRTATIIATAALFYFTLWQSIAAADQGGQGDWIHPGEIWPDDRGQHIQAHGGSIIKVGDLYYWFGEDRARGQDRSKRYVGCYSSPDLIHWTFRNQVIKLANPENFNLGWVLERPKVFYNAATQKFVMYMHIDGSLGGQRGSYNLARVGTATCDTVDGDYTYLHSFRPLGHESRDIGQFVDDDGTAYLISEDRPNGFHIYKLSDDYLSIDKDVCLIRQHMEGGALVHYNGLYYSIGSHLTSWDPNPNEYATATKLEGPWSEFKNIAPPETNTYGSQSTMLLKVVGSQTTSVIFMGDMWKPRNLADSRYLWMPLEIGEGKLWLSKPQSWTFDVKTGESRLADQPAHGNAAGKSGEKSGTPDAKSGEDNPFEDH
jgi:hypothetical protein